MNNDQITNKKREIINIAKQILNEDINYIIGCRKISELLYGLFKDSYIYENFSVFSTINSATDHLPTGKYRQHWNKEALKKKDKEVQQIYRLYKKDLTKETKNLIEKLSDM